jgi:uncharacterized heparinase superfamily protein
MSDDPHKLHKAILTAAVVAGIAAARSVIDETLHPLKTEQERKALRRGGHARPYA